MPDIMMQKTHRHATQPGAQLCCPNSESFSKSCGSTVEHQSCSAHKHLQQHQGFIGHSELFLCCIADRVVLNVCSSVIA